MAQVPSTLAAAEVPAAAMPAEASTADMGTEAPVPEELVLGDVEAEAPLLAAGAASRDTESEAASRAAAAGRGSETLRTADLISVGGHSRTPAALADGARLAAGALAITAAILALSGLPVVYQTVSGGTSSFRLADYSWDKWYVILGAVVDLVAGVCLVIPRTKRLIGPGILLGNVAVSSGGLAFLIVSMLANSGYGSGFWLEFAASLAEVAAACLVGIAVDRTDEIRLSRWPGRAGLTWIIVLIGAAAAVALAFHAHNLSAAAMYDHMTTAIWTAIMALIVPVCATAVKPRLFAVALLGGWLAADVAFLVYYIPFLTYERDNGYAAISPVPLLVFGFALVAIVAVGALIARGAPSGGAAEGT